MLSPNPPRKLCSSADTIAFVFFAELITISSSKGLIVWIFIISADIPISSSFFEASRDSQTKCPVDIIVTSLPSFKIIPLPILKLKLCS